MATDTWNGIGTWDTDANWSEGHPPAPADDAVIASGQDELDNPGTVVNSLTIDSNAQLILRNTGGTDTVTHDLVNDGFLYVDETGYGNGGSTLTIGGTLTNSSYVFIGNTGLSADTTVSAAALDDSSGIYIEVTGNTNAGTTNQASLEIAGAAPVTLTRNLILQGDALVDFGSGGIATIASGAELELQGSEARVSSGTTPTDTATSTALTGLTDIVGELDLRGNAPAAGGATVTTTTDLDNSGNLFVDYDGYGDGGSTLSIAGTLTNSTNVQIGNTGLSGDTTVSAAALVNTGQIFLTGNTNSGTTDQATINIAGMAPTTLTGDFYLQGDALLDFGSGVIATIASGAEIRLEGSGSRVSSGTTTTDTATSTALTGLTANAGVLDLRGDSPAAGGATVTTTTDLDSSNAIYVDYDGYGDGGSTLSIGGTLTNSGVLFIGNTGLVADTNVSAMALANTSAGQIHIVGNTGSATSDQATFAVGGPAPTSLEGNVFLQGDALLDFASGAIATIASDAFLGLDGAEARVSSGTTPTDTATSTALTGLTDIAGELDLRGNAPAFGGATVTIAGDLANSGDLAVDYDGYGDGGSTLTIGGTLTNSANLNIGNTGLSANTTVTAAGLVNAGTIRLAGNTGAGATDQASLNIAEAAPTVLTGVYILQGDALLDFGSGGIATIESAAELELQGSGARVSSGTSATATATSTALTGLTDIAGELDLRGIAPAAGGATVTIAGDLANSGALYLDQDGYGDGGSTLSIGGMLTNSDMMNIGNTGLSADTTVSAAGLVNNGPIHISGNTGSGATNQASLNIAGAAPTVLSGQVYLQGDALLDFGSGGIATIASGAQLELQGSEARVSSGTTAADTATSTALTGLADNLGILDLRGNAPAAGGATVTLAGNFTNNSYIAVDSDGYGDGSSTLAVGGTLTNAGSMNIGNTGDSGDTLVSAGALLNTGTIDLTSETGNTSSLVVSGAATISAGLVRLYSSGVLSASAIDETGGAIDGDGTLAGVFNLTGGTLEAFDPTNGNALATLTVAGVYNESGAGVLQADINNNDTPTSGVIAVTGGPGSPETAGSVNLQGGTLEVNLESSNLTVGTPYTVMTFGGGRLYGIFGTVATEGSLGTNSGSGTSVALTSGNYAGDTLQVLYNDAAGTIQVEIVSPAAANAYTWIAGPGNWDTAADWSPTGVPGPNSAVTIGAGSGGTVTLSHDATVSSLTVTSSYALNSTAGTLAVNGNVIVSQGGTLAAGGVNDGGAFIDNGAVTLNGALTSLGTITVGSTGSLSLTGGAINMSTVTGSGAIGTPGGNSGALYNVTLTAGTTFTGADNSTTNLYGTIDNAGTISVDSTGDNTDLRASDGTTLTGGGTVLLSDNPNNRIFGTGNSGSETLTNVNNTIAGAGQFSASNRIEFINEAGGTIDATGASHSLVITPTTNSSVATPNGGGFVNAGLLEATDAGGLVLNGGGFNNKGGTIKAVGSGNNVYLQQGAVISGGLLTTSGGGLIEVATGQSGSLDGSSQGALTNAGTFLVADNGALFLSGVIDNTGTINLASTVDNTDLRASNGTTLTGGGTVLLSDEPNNRIFGASDSGNETLTNVNNTIEGSGQFSASNRIEFINQAGGTIDATGASHSLVITPTTNSSVATPNGGGFVNAGLLEATGAGGLVLNSGGFNNKGGTIKAVGSGNNVYLQSGATVSGGLLTTSGGGLIEVATGQSGSLDGSSQGAITNAGTFLVADNGALFLSGVIDNTGTINLASTVDNTDLRASDGTTLTGSGTVLLSDEPNNRIFGSANNGNETLTNLNNTIEGSGQFGASNRIEFINEVAGTIDATGSTHSLVITPTTNSSVTTPNGGGFVNMGLLEATGAGGLVLSNGGFNNKGGTIEAIGSGNNVYLQSGATVSGGLLTTSGGGLIEVATGQTGSLDGSSQGAITNAGTFLVADSGALFVSGVIDNTGTINLASTGDNTDLRASDGTTLTGSGTVLLSDNPNNRIFGTGNSGSETLTNVNNTIAGAGQFSASNRIEFINEAAGTIDATGASHSLVITPTTNGSVTTPNGGGFVNAGLLEATGAGGLVLNSGGFNNKGGTIKAVGSGNNVYLQQGAVISGGLLTTSGGGLIEVATGQSGSLDGSSQGAITNAGTFLVADSGALFVSGVIDNTGTINLASTGDNTDLRIADGTTLTGGGTVLLSDSSNNRIFGSVNNGNETLTNLNNTIEGAGQFSASNRIAVVNGGTIAATGTNALVMALTTNLSPGLTNQAGGLLLATGSGGLQITTGSVSNLGTVEAKDGSSVTYSSGVTDLNNVSGTLTGGVWEAVASGHGATISVTGGAVTTDAADIILSGPGSVFQAGNGNTFTPIDTSLTTIAAGGELDVLNGRNFTTTNAFTNDGKIVVTGGTFTADGASFLNAGTIAVTNGTLAADGASFSNTGAMSFLGNAGTAAIAGSIGNSTTITASAMAGGEVDLQGTIAGGTVIGTPLTGKGGELSGVTFDGTLDLSGSADSATIAGGITFKGATGTGPALVNLTGSQAALYTSGSETLSNATIDIGSGGPFAASLINDPNGAGSTTLTLGASLLIDQTGALAQINGDGGNNDAIVNMGSIDAGDAGGTLTIGAGGFTNDSTITVTGERLVAGAPGFTNNGSIAVTNGTLAANSTGFSNAGTMSFVGNAGTAAIAGTVGNSGTITASAMGGGEVDLSGAIDGGTVVGMPLTGKGGTLDGVAFDGTLDLSGSGDVATIVGGITFKGAGGSGPALVNLTGAGATLDTVGSETLNNATIDIGSSGTAATLYNDANNAGNTTLTLGPSLLVHQTGANAAISGSNAAGDAIVNQGTIDPASSGGTMTIAANNFTNDGTINLSGDTLDITGTGFTDAGTIENGTVIGTVMAESGTLDAVTLDGTLDLLSTDVEKIAGGIVLNGQDGAGPASINLTGASAALAILGSQTLTNATIDLGGSGGAPTLYDGFGAGGGATLTLGSSLVIDQTGLHGAISGSNGTTGNVIVNMGTIDAGDAGGTLTIGAASFTNDGQMSIGAETVDASGIAITDAGTITLAGGTLTAASLTINAGGQLSGYGTVTDPVNNGTMTASGGLLDITSPVTGTGTLDIAPTGTLELGSTVNGNTVDFLGNPNTGTLEIDDLASNPGGVQTQDFNAPIAGFASGEIIAIGTSHLGNGNALTSASPGAYNATTNTTPLVLYDLITPVATLTLDGNYSGHAFALAPNPQNPSYDEAQEIPCFCTGTMILTPSGEVPVESLRVGDPVVTWNGAARPITWIGQGRTLVTAKNRIYAAPVILRRDALAPGVPHRDLRVTAGHGICLDGVLIPAGLLVNGRTILRDERDQVVEFYHVELADQDILLADGAPAESYRDDNNRGAFEEPVFHNATGPAFAGIGAAPYAPALSDGPQVQHAWRRLAERAGAPSAETLTEEADLHLLADGERVEGERIGGEGPAEAVYCFRLERLPAELRIASRRAVPAELGLGRDWRALGVGLRRIVLRQPGAAIDIAYDAALLDRGFHAAEPEAGLRWTDGDGLIPGAAYAVLDGPFEVQVEVAATLRYPAATDANPAGEVCGQAA